MNPITPEQAKALGIHLPEPVVTRDENGQYQMVIARLDVVGIIGNSPKDALRNARQVLRSKGCNVVLLGVIGSNH